MNFHVMTLFPEMIEQGLSTSVLGRAMERGLISLDSVNIRDYTLDKHKRVDDYPYGGGAGMVMAADPVVRCYRAIAEKMAADAEIADAEITEKETAEKMRMDAEAAETGALYAETEHAAREEKKRPRVIYLTPQGRTFTQELAQELAREDDLIFLCGHYEGIDERALELIVTDEVSIGDYVLTGGELPAMVMIDAIARLVPGVLNNQESAEFETFHDHLLEYPQYTRPEVYEGRRVPEVLLSGHHARIEEWRRQQSILRTHAIRPELLLQAVGEGLLNKKELRFYRELLEGEEKTKE